MMNDDVFGLFVLHQYELDAVVEEIVNGNEIVTIPDDFTSEDISYIENRVYEETGVCVSLC